MAGVIVLSMTMMLAALPVLLLLQVDMAGSTVSFKHSLRISGRRHYGGGGQQQQQEDEDQDRPSPDHHPTADGAGVPHEFLEAHNRVRAKYGVPPLRWSAKLARYARHWSSMRRFDCVLMHSPGSPYGENVFWGTGGDWRASDAVASWASEASYFDWRSQTCYPGQVCGHFTQIVWNDTEFLGCGRTQCFAGGVFITCSYDPPGNWKGEVPLT